MIRGGGWSAAGLRALTRRSPPAARARSRTGRRPGTGRGVGRDVEREVPRTSNGRSRGSATATSPSSPGSQSQRVRVMAASPRPSVTTSAQHARSRPCPSPSPVHRRLTTRSRTCAPGQSPATRSTPRLRRNVASRRCLTWAGARPGERSRTSSHASSSDATTCGQAGPGSGTSRVRSASRPRPAAASTPASGIPAIPHHAPSADAAAARARHSRPNSATASTDPRARQPLGSSPRRAGSTGSVPAPQAPGSPGTCGAPGAWRTGAIRGADGAGGPVGIHSVSAAALPIPLIIEYRFGLVKALVRYSVNIIRTQGEEYVSE